MCDMEEKTIEFKGVTSTVLVFDEVESTNDIAKKMAKEGACDRTVIIANSQTGGRGRMGRSFLSKPGGIYMSFILKPDVPAFDALKITAGAAVAVRRAVSKYAEGALIKWVNDIYINGKKGAGILAESVIDEDGKMCIILGIGVNLFGKSEDFGPELSDIVTTIEENAAFLPEKREFAYDIAREVFDVYDSLNDFSLVIEEYKKYSLVLNKKVFLVSGETKKEAFVIDIDDNGGLIVEQDGEVKTISTGEVSLRF